MDEKNHSNTEEAVMGLVDVVISYTFIKDVSTPFDKTKAYEVGIIDDKDGKILVKNKDLECQVNEKYAYPNRI
jgi:hypothetical protein